MLKIVLLAYRRGLFASRRIEAACRQNVQFMAISGDSQPSYTHIAKFVRELGQQIQPLFTQVLLVCDRQGLIGRQMFAIDGVKLPSNASKERSGTHEELRHRTQRLDSSGNCCRINGRVAHKYKGTQGGCGACTLRAKCLRHPERTAVRQVAVFASGSGSGHVATELMKQAIDTAKGRALYSQRIATVEPVFANIRHTKRLDRFTLRGKEKMGTQWRLYGLVHNIEKLARNGCR